VKRVLFVCSQNRLRSPTAEAVFSNRICLDIPDEFEYMDPALVRLLELKAGPFFKRG
jgi:predicted protein tyrosine phosphatase